jgi:hypothetical protein
MKEIRTTMDAIGRETNAITQSMAFHRHEIAAIGAVKSGFEALERARADRDSACRRIEAAEAAAAAVRIQLDEAAEAARRLEADPAYQDARAREKVLANLEEEGKQIDREYRVLAASVTHVFKKAGNIGSRQGNTTAGKTFAEAIRVLEWFPQSEEAVIALALAAAVPEALALVKEGLLELKNKEERALFADSETPAREILGVIGRYRTWDARFSEERSAISAAPSLAAARDLDARKTALSADLDYQLHARTAAADQFARSEATIPALEKTLCQALARRLGKPVVLEIDERRLECPPK